jgi:hypothetical protein
MRVLYFRLTNQRQYGLIIHSRQNSDGELVTLQLVDLAKNNAHKTMDGHFLHKTRQNINNMFCLFEIFYPFSYSV